MSNPNTQSAAPRWFALINDRIIIAPRQMVPVSVLKTLASIPEGHVLVRDHSSPHDVAFDDHATVDLAQGNVFYSRAHASPPDCSGSPGPAKLAFAVDDRFELSTVEELPIEAFLGLFGLGNGTTLLRDFESPNDKPLVPGSTIRFGDGPFFTTQSGCHHEKHVEITIDGTKFRVKSGSHSVVGLKTLGHVPVADELVQVLAGTITPLPDDATVCINGGEEFISHPRQGGSS